MSVNIGCLGHTLISSEISRNYVNKIDQSLLSDFRKQI